MGDFQVNIDWPHQVAGTQRTKELLNAGARRICFTSPTGGGKSRCMHRLLEMGRPTVVYANRTMLIEQLAKGMNDAGIPFGMQVSGYAPSVFENVQIASIQTVSQRFSKGKMLPHNAELVVIDEWHNERSERCQKLVEWHLENGASVVGFTATPVGLEGLADELVQAGCNSELFRCKALVPARTFAGNEIDMRACKSKSVGVLELRDELKEVMMPVIFGSVIEHYKLVNPDCRPSIMFAPGVDESRWLTEQMNKAGFPWSHIDGERISINGTDMPANRDNRMLLLEVSKTHRTLGISNRFVMREGIDATWLAHCIFACRFGSLSSYLQSGGRVLRAHPGLDGVTVSDHGANYLRFDTLNVDRQWELGDTDAELQKKREEQLRNKEKSEPIVCPKCSKIREKGVECPACGFVARGRRRMVIQTDGTLKEIHGDVYRPRKVNTSPEDHKKWKACVYRCKAKGMNFNQARGLFLRETGTVPGPDFPLVPVSQSDWGLKVSDVPYERLSK
jgi:superfamily II DNA or RNA helicase